MTRFFLLAAYILACVVPLLGSASEGKPVVTTRLQEKKLASSQEQEKKEKQAAMNKRAIKGKKKQGIDNKKPNKRAATSELKGRPTKKSKENPKQANKEKESGITITYYNVGQGNCVLMENKDKGQAVLVDCGSRESDNKLRKGLGKPPIDITAVLKKIRQQLDQYDNNIFIVTHADEDHYNKISDIIDSKKKTDFIISTGSDLKDPHKEKSVASLKKSLDANKRNTIEVKDPEDLEDALKKLKLNDWIEAVAAAASTSDNPSTNADSIVIKAHSGKCSALLTGDAEDLIGRQIESKSHTDSLSTTVLLASHHGSETEHSNSEAWIKAASAQIVIVSAGHNRQHRHPRCSILQRYLNKEINSNLLKFETHHRLTCSSDFLDFQSFKPLDLPEESRFTGVEAIYNTFDQGDITVELNTSGIGKDNFSLSATHGNDKAGLKEQGTCASRIQ